MRTFRLCLAAVILAVCAHSQEFHTTPDKWKEPRPFHQPLDSSIDGKAYQARVKVGPSSAQVPLEGRVLSANKAYWFYADNPGCEGLDGARRRPRAIDIFTERPSLLRLTLIDTDCRYAGEVRWISEKLLFVRLWWGRVLGSDLILDVEQERVLYHELVNDGGLAFIQWQGQANPPR